MLRFWLNLEGNRATGNALERALRKCDREDVVNKCMFNVELVTDEKEQSAAKEALHLDQVKLEGAVNFKYGNGNMKITAHGDIRNGHIKKVW